MLCFYEFVFKIGQHGTLSAGYHYIVHVPKDVKNKVLKPDILCIIPSRGYRMRDRESIEALQWLAYIGQTRNNISHAGNWS